MRTIKPRLAEHGWVEDTRPPTDGRRGRISVLCSAEDWALVSWGNGLEHLETVVDPATSLRPVVGEVGEVEDLQFAPPPCPFDDTTLDVNGDGWACPTCQTRWNHHGEQGVRVCVDCGADAAVIDLDGQSRCQPCASDQ